MGASVGRKARQTLPPNAQRADRPLDLGSFEETMNKDAVSDASGAGEISDAARNARHLTAFAFFFSIFVNLLMLTGPLFMLQVYDRVLGSRSEETLVALLILVIGLYALMWMLDFARARLVARFGARLQSKLDARVFSAQLTRPNDPSRPEQASAANDLEAIQTFYASPVFLALMDAPFTPVFIAAIFIFHPLLGIFALAIKRDQVIFDAGAGTVTLQRRTLFRYDCAVHPLHRVRRAELEDMSDTARPILTFHDHTPPYPLVEAYSTSAAYRRATDTINDWLRGARRKAAS